MVRSKILRSKLLAVAGMLCLITGVASAQELDETGVVHITDSPAVAAQNGLLRTNCDKAAGAGFGNSAGCQNGNCQNCQSGVCQNGGGSGCRSCQNGYGGYGCRPYGRCPLGVICPIGGAGCNGCNSCCGKLSCSARKILAWLDPCSGVCSYAPSHGFMIPGKQPYFRQPVSYQHNYPAKWTGGHPSGYHGHRPAVYTPTDTTQLGYYYQKVPTWVPVPGMIPPAPRPQDWHQFGPTSNAAPYYPVESVQEIEGEPTPVESNDADNLVPPAAPAAPAPPKEIDKVDLERSASNPNLLPILK